MRAFNFDRPAVLTAAHLNAATSLRPSLISNTFRRLIPSLLLSMGIGLLSAHAQTSSVETYGNSQPASDRTITRAAPVWASLNDADVTPLPQAAITYEFVGSFKVFDGQVWVSGPPVYSGREAAALIFGGALTDYAISTNSNTTDPATIDHKAWLDGCANTQFLTTPNTEDFKQGTVYNSPCNGTTYSALVKDNSGGTPKINYVWRAVGVAPPPVTFTTGDVLISEFRLRGPNGTPDEFVELYNTRASAITVRASDGSAGWALRTSDGATRFVVPNGVIIPARGHYLACFNPNSNARYSLSNYGGFGAAAQNLGYDTDIPDAVGLALFSSSTLFNAATRLDSVGFSSVANNLFFEGTGLAPSSGITTNAEHSITRVVTTGGLPQDTNNNAADFIIIATSPAAVTGATARLGAPGPETLTSPRIMNAQFPGSLLDASSSSSSAPNRTRDMTSDGANNSQLGTMTIRRRITNNTGAAVTRLRFRVVVITGSPVADAASADLRVRSSSDTTVNNVSDAATCAATGTPATTPCTVTVRGTTLENPPAQASGGGLNSSLTVAAITNAPISSEDDPVAGGGPNDDGAAPLGLPDADDTIDLDTPLANGASINVQFLLGVQKTGAFKFFINIEALP